MLAGHRFPRPWSVTEEDDHFVVQDRNGRALCYVYFKGKRGRALATAMFTRDAAWHIADSLAELPELLRKF
jgi:hypothetical protein